MRAEALGIALSWAPGRSAYVPLAHSTIDLPQALARDEAIEALRPLVVEFGDLPDATPALGFEPARGHPVIVIGERQRHAGEGQVRVEGQPRLVSLRAVFDHAVKFNRQVWPGQGDLPEKSGEDLHQSALGSCSVKVAFETGRNAPGEGGGVLGIVGGLETAEQRQRPPGQKVGFLGGRPGQPAVQLASEKDECREVHAAQPAVPVRRDEEEKAAPPRRPGGQRGKANAPQKRAALR